MDYKKIIKSRDVRLAILKCLRFIPDKPMLQLQYRIKTGRKLNLRDPKRYTEKLQWYKLYHRDPLMVQCVDKYDVRAYVESKGLGHILNECYGVFDRVEDIDFNKLPNQFVLKDTLGGGGNAVIIVKDKASMDLETVKKQLQKWVDEDHRVPGGGREWPYYSGKKHRIIAERYIPSDESKGGLIDYKFLCFAGETACAYVVVDRTVGQNASFGIFDKNFNQLPYGLCGKQPWKRDVNKPENWDKMIAYARTLSEQFPHARIDLYDQEGTVIFGEITFHDGSGYVQFNPDEYDFMLGECFVLPSKMESLHTKGKVGKP